MAEPLPVRVEEGRVLAPAVGLWSAHPAPGALLSPGSAVGALTQGNRTRTLALPPGASGRIVSALPRDRVVPVGYGTLLFELAPLTADAVAAGEERSPAHAVEGVPAGARAVLSPTDGVFYRRSGPGVAAFVEVGQTVRAGQPIGLVEVMKTFNQVLYGGADLPHTATVLEIRAEDGAEIRAGHVLLLVREA